MRAALVLALCVSALPARANEDPDTEVARRHFLAGRTAYDAGDYEKALDEFQKANRVKPAPAFDYNIGRCFDRLERYDEAIAAYDKYVASHPPDAAEVRDRVATLKARLATAPPPKPAEPVAPPPEKPAPEKPAPDQTILPSALLEAPPPAPAEKPKRHAAAIALGIVGGAVVIGGAIALGLLLKPATAAATPDDIGGPRPGTK